MEYIEILPSEIERLRPLHAAYKRAIGEAEPTEAELARLAAAMAAESIRFFGCVESGALVGCCSVTAGWSTFNYGPSGVFEDFFILPEWRHRGIARALVRFAKQRSGVQSLTVGCADCDLGLYGALGFTLKIGNLLAFDAGNE